MKQIAIKIRLLLGILSYSWIEWKREIWGRDLDELYCCDGRGCACGGETIEQLVRREFLL